MGGARRTFWRMARISGHALALLCALALAAGQDPARGAHLASEAAKHDIRPLVVIDPGHGGHDPGAVNEALGLSEKNVTLAIARSIRSELLKSGGVRVALTRDDDRFLKLFQRYAIAQRLGASLFISIHADAATDSSAHGATVYTLSELASDRLTAKLDRRVDKSHILNGVDLTGESADISSLLISVAQRETMNVSIRFADLLRRVAIGHVPFRDTAHLHAGFAVLKAPDMPSILFETGYITNDADARFLTSAAGHAGIATAVAKATSIHFARKPSSR